MANQTTETPTKKMETQIPFVPFHTPFAKRICTIAGVEKLIQLKKMQIILYHKEFGFITEIEYIGHHKENNHDGSWRETITLLFYYRIDLQYEVVLCDDVTYFSGVIQYPEHKGNDGVKMRFYVTIGPDERLLCTPLGELADMMEINPDTKVGG